jgi:hypothetical protein
MLEMKAETTHVGNLESQNQPPNIIGKEFVTNK